MARPTIGILALQGDFAKHIEILKNFQVSTLEVRKPQELDACDALIIPGGESTTIARQIHFIHIHQKLVEFAQSHPIFGTCAGLILMSKKIISEQRLKPFGWLDIAVERNAYGRQAESFRTEIELFMDRQAKATIQAVFIRAPRIREIGDTVEILASFEGEPILVRQGKHLGATFHPEITGEAAVHEYFIKLIP